MGGEMLPDKGNAGGMAECFGRGEPDGENWDGDTGRKGERFHRWISVDHRALAEADACAGAHKLPIGGLVIAADAEPVAGGGEACGAHALEDIVGAIVADEGVVGEVFGGLRCAVGGEVAFGGAEGEGDIAQVFRDDVELAGAIHADGDIGLAEKQVFGGVRRGQFDLEFGVLCEETCEDGRQDMERDHF